MLVKFMAPLRNRNLQQSRKKPSCVTTSNKRPLFKTLKFSPVKPLNDHLSQATAINYLDHGFVISTDLSSCNPTTWAIFDL